MPSVLSGQKIAALAITEASGGSDVANLKTRAVSEGDFYRVNGSKTFITSGHRADYYTVAVRTGDVGYGGISLLLIERERAGFSVGKPLKKMGWWASDTAELFFNDVLVPKSNLRLGNIHFKSSTNRSPQKTTSGHAGEIRQLRLELKVLADVGLLGLPNAGKSTFIRAVSPQNLKWPMGKNVA